MAPDGVEQKLIAFIDNPSRAVDDTTWFSFDRLEFDTASAAVLARSMPQLRNIAAIMNCYPDLTLKVGGYTDNVGDPASNLTLSQTRAEQHRRGDCESRHLALAPRGGGIRGTAPGGEQRLR